MAPGGMWVLWGRDLSIVLQTPSFSLCPLKKTLENAAVDSYSAMTENASSLILVHERNLTGSPGEFEHRSSCTLCKGVAPWRRVD